MVIKKKKIKSVCHTCLPCIQLQCCPLRNQYRAWLGTCQHTRRLHTLDQTATHRSHKTFCSIYAHNYHQKKVLCSPQWQTTVFHYNRTPSRLNSPSWQRAGPGQSHFLDCRSRDRWHSSPCQTSYTDCTSPRQSRSSGVQWPCVLLEGSSRISPGSHWRPGHGTNAQGWSPGTQSPHRRKKTVWRPNWKWEKFAFGTDQMRRPPLRCHRKWPWSMYV